MKYALLLFVVALAGCDNCGGTAKKGGPVGEVVDPNAYLTPDASVLNVATVPDKDVIAMVNPDHLPAYIGPTGSIEGTVKVIGPAAPPSGITEAAFAMCPDSKNEYGKQFRAGEVTDSNNAHWLADAIVVVTGYKGFWVPEKKEAVVVDIDGCGTPHRTITMTFGQRLEIKNLTNEFWTPLLEPAQGGAMMMAPPHNTDPVKLYPKKAGRHALVDHDRKYFINDLMVMRHPLHAVTDVMTGHYRIDGVPVGKMHVSASHPQIKHAGSTMDTVVRSGETATVNFELTYKPDDVSDGGAAEAQAPYPGLH